MMPSVHRTAAANEGLGVRGTGSAQGCWGFVVFIGHVPDSARSNRPLQCTMGQLTHLRVRLFCRGLGRDSLAKS